MITVVPMAGYGNRFANKGITIPKPLIEVAGKPMLHWALKSVETVPHRMLVFVMLREHEEEFGILDRLTTMLSVPFEAVLLDKVTEGQLCTVLTAREFFKPDEGVLVSNCDTYTQSNIGAEIQNLPGRVHGLISVADLPGDRWSFARTEDSGKVVEVAEKERISNHASTGLYYFSHASEFLDYADSMVEEQDRTKGEYYVMPLYGRYLRDGKDIRISIAEKMWDLGTPEALQEFLRAHTQ